LAITTLLPGDVLVVAKLDRLCRSVSDLSRIVDTLKERGAALKALDVPAIDTSTAQGLFVAQILGAVAQLERGLIKQRQKAGIDKAKVLGVYKGRQKSIDDGAIRKLKVQGLTIAEICRSLKVSRASAYRALQEAGGDV